MKRLILASASPRRKEILTQLGISFEVRSAAISEELSGPFQEEYPRILAERKALYVSKQEPDFPVLGFDTLVFFNGEVLGKPRDRAFDGEFETAQGRTGRLVQFIP